MEKNIRIKTGDGHLIYGVLNSVKSKNLVIFVHGLGDDKNVHIFFNAAKFFTKRGFDTFRFDLYSGEAKGRLLSDCDLDVNAADTDAVMKYFRKYKKAFLVGHSYGGTSILKTKTRKVSGLVLWEPSVSYRMSSLLKNVKRVGKLRLLNWRMEFVIGEKICREWKNFPTPKELMKNINVPIKIVCAGDSKMTSARKLYYDLAKGPREFVVIKNAGHNFDEEGAEEKLFKETLKFARKY